MSDRVLYIQTPTLAKTPVGEAQESPDLSGYATKEEVNTALDGKVDKVSGKGLSTNDFTTTEKSKLAGIQAGAQVNPDLSVYATKEEVKASLTGKADKADVHNIPSGGAAGQFLIKQSATDYDAAWVTVPSANGVSF